MANKTGTGNFFEDFRVGATFVHATPRTLNEGDVALNVALYGSRLAVNSSSLFASRIGLPDAPIDDVFVFNVVFGKTVPDISLNAIANLGYAAGRFGQPVYPGDTMPVSGWLSMSICSAIWRISGMRAPLSSIPHPRPTDS